MVKRYRPWSDHGGSPVLEELGEDGLTPPLAPEIYPDYDTVVVLHSDYAALEARVADAEALQRAYVKLEALCRELEAALKWACEWVPNPTECSPAPSNEIVRIIHETVIGSTSETSAKS